MRAKYSIFGGTLLLALNVAAINHVVYGAAPAPAGHVTVTQWKSIPEDSATWRREPFQSPEAPKQVTGPSPLQNSVVASPELALQGIMMSNKRYYAIIDGRTVKPGDQINGWSIADISRHRVTIRRNKEKQVYDIYQGRIDRGTR